jgi:DNA repair exonuclease SbcCD ATPase subunit
MEMIASDNAQRRRERIRLADVSAGGDLNLSVRERRESVKARVRQIDGLMPLLKRDDPRRAELVAEKKRLEEELHQLTARLSEVRRGRLADLVLEVVKERLTEAQWLEVVAEAKVRYAVQRERLEAAA